MPSGIKMTLDDFIKKAREKHGDKYKYGLINEFKGCRVKVPVICPKHGIFMTTPYSHIQGKGCRLCANEENKQRLLYSTEKFIQKAKEKYGDEYDYSKVDMEHRDENGKICIICHRTDEFGDEHGEFWMQPKSHLAKQGCPKCGGIYHYTTEEWIEKAKKLHSSENYDYSKVEYKNNYTKVCIICPIHGEFWRNPKTFLYHRIGCPKCTCKSIIEEDIALLLNSNNIKYIREVTRKTFVWLENMRLDFYIPEYNIAIEVQGLQHFKPVDFASKGYEWAKKNYEENKIRDNKKKQLCKEYGVKLLYFAKLHIDYPYDVIEDEKILLNEIYKNGKSLL